MNEARPITTRMWEVTLARFQRFQRSTGLQMVKQIDAAVNGWGKLTAEQQQQAILASDPPDKAASGRALWPTTREKLDAIQLVTQLEGTKLIDVLSHGWELLSDEQRREAITEIGGHEPSTQT
jgi:hypothetical protein